MFVIFENEADAQAYIQAANVFEEYPRLGNPPTPPGPNGEPGYGWTKTWDEPRVNVSGTRWAVSVHPDVAVDGTVVSELTGPEWTQ